jgi:hypothetical protein
MPGFREESLAVGDPVFASPLAESMLRRYECGVADHAQERVGLDPGTDAFFSRRREQEPRVRWQVAGRGMASCHGHDTHGDATQRPEAGVDEHQGAAALMTFTREASGSSCL